MWICPVCNKENNENQVCVDCGYDKSRDVQKYRSIVRLTQEELEDLSAPYRKKEQEGAKEEETEEEEAKQKTNNGADGKGNKGGHTKLVKCLIGGLAAAVLVVIICLFVLRTPSPTLEYKSGQLADAEIGSTVLFGSYEQDNDPANGKEDIEWLVLDKQEDRVLVISKYGIDCKGYHESYMDITWEECSLRSWLNDTFLASAFNEEEQAMIPTVTVKAEDNPEYGTEARNDTEDKIFLLSISEANNYFSSDYERKCKPTVYAAAQVGEVSSLYDGWWWLRSPGGSSNLATGVSNDGSVYYYGDGVINSSGCVRPAIWIDLKS